MDKKLFVISFGMGTGAVAMVIGIVTGEIFLAYVGTVCFLTNLYSIKLYLERLWEK